MCIYIYIHTSTYIYIYYIHTRVERALRPRIGPWALMGSPLGPGPSPVPSPGPWWGHAEALGPPEPCGDRALREPWELVGPSPGPSPGPWALPWALRGPCGDRALAAPQQIRKKYHSQRLKSLNVSNRIIFSRKN